MSNSKPTTENPSLTTPRDEQPAAEWASTTLSALDPANDPSQPPEAHSVPETPGVSMPGSFPMPKQALAVPDIQGVTVGALKTAKEYAQTAGQGTQTALQNAGDKVGAYLPSGVASYLSGSGTQQEPSTDTHPFQETSQTSTSGGVGTPDHPDERTIGKPVDQVASADLAETSPIVTTTNNNPVHRRPSDPLERNTGYIPGTLQDDTSLAKLPEERRLEGLPSHDDETGTRLGKSGGVGALPGPANESSVALLPDERKELQGSPSGTGGGEAATGTNASDRPLPGGSSSYTPSPLGQSRFVPQTTGRDHAFSRDEGKIFGANAKKDLDLPDTADAVKGDVPTSPTRGTNGQDTHAVGAGSGGLAGAGSASQFESEVTKKSGFIHKVKGEMKILSGKMSHNETKIEEGRKMMGKN